GLEPMAVQFALAMFGFFWLRSYWDDWDRVDQVALRVAGESGDSYGEAVAHSDLGVMYWRRGRHGPATDHHHRSLAIRQQIGDGGGEARSRGNLALVYMWQGQLDQARQYLQDCLAIQQRLDDSQGQALSLGNLGIVHARQGRH